jgi:hypothetical protein
MRISSVDVVMTSQHSYSETNVNEESFKASFNYDSSKRALYEHPLYGICGHTR